MEMEQTEEGRKHAICFRAEGTGIVAVDGAGAVRKSCTIGETEDPAIRALKWNSGAVAARTEGFRLEKIGKLVGGEV